MGEERSERKSGREGWRKGERKAERRKERLIHSQMWMNLVDMMRERKDIRGTHCLILFIRRPQFGSVQCSVMSNTLRPHRLQHSRPPCPILTPGVYSNWFPLSQWCHPTISSSVVPFSSSLQSCPASGSFPMSQLFAWGSQSLEFQLQHQSFQWIFRTDFL